MNEEDWQKKLEAWSAAAELLKYTQPRLPNARIKCKFCGLMASESESWPGLDASRFCSQSCACLYTENYYPKLPLDEEKLAKIFFEESQGRNTINDSQR